MQPLSIQYLAIDELKPNPRNSRTHSVSQIDKLAKSIKEFGFNDPVHIDKDKMLICGHARLEAAKKAGLTSIPTVSLAHLSKTQQKIYLIAHNRIALDAGWDNDLLREDFAELNALGFDLELTGFSIDEIEKLSVIDDKTMGLSDPDELQNIEDNYEPITKSGDVWLLGNHRLMCGDSTMIDSVEKLINNENIHMVFTDPPYGINEETDRNFASKSRITHGNTFDKIIGDDSTKTAIDCYNLCEGLKISIMIFWGANYYCHSLPETANWLVWDKREEDKERDMNSDCELAWVKSKAKSVRIFRHKWKGMIKASEHGQGRVHPTQKPIALAEWTFNEYGKDLESILDLFGGSGSTLIACENTKRKCFMMEISPTYCDVIIKRWEKFTGKKAINQQTGIEFKG